MSNIIKLKMPKALNPDGTPRTPLSTSTAPSTSGTGIRLKLTNSQPPTPLEAPSSAILPAPASTEKKKRPYVRKTDAAGNKKRSAEDELISPAAKRVQNGAAPGRKLSIKLTPQQREDAGAAAKRKGSAPKIIDIRARQRAPPRAKGIGYDSEDSDVEKDPAIQQVLILRMQPGPDAEYLRQAIADGKIGPYPSAGDADVSLKFVEKGYRRAVVKVRGNMYAAVLVDLPCIVETMKSFDRKGWWKVADCCQMLLVLGRCASDDEARHYRLPPDVDRENFQFAHGLTPPLRAVRKRRWRARPNYNHAVEAEEQAQRLLEMDLAVEEAGGSSSYTLKKGAMDLAPESQYGDDDEEEDAEGEEDDAVETVEGQDGATMQYTFGDEEDEEDAGDLEAQLAAQMEFADDDEDDATPAATTATPAPAAAHTATGGPVVQSPTALEQTPAGTPGPSSFTAPPSDDDGAAAGGPPSSSDEDSGDDDDDDDGMDVFDADAAAKSAERAQQLEEVADLEQEVERTRQKAASITNQLLKQRELRKLVGLEEDLKAKKVMFGLEEE